MIERKRVAPPKGAQAAQEKLIRKMYISNVAKRLRQLNQPSDTDKKRWIWELIQNAKDTIANDPTRDSVNIKIKIDGDNVIFVHDGNPFTLDARFGLLWKYSEDKENPESTGRFGTGFLTTHCLSKVVSIESDVYDDDNYNNLIGFRVTMFRDGDTESELLEGLDKMRNSEEWMEPFNHTSFTYHLKSASGRDAVKLGVSNFYENIAQTMLFCPELSSVVMDDNGTITTITRGDSIPLENGIELASINFSGVSNHTRKFLAVRMERESPELTARYKQSRRLRLQIAIEINYDNSIVDKGNSCGLYCVLPLVGIESQLEEPIYINCPDFEPDEERQSLLLNGQAVNGENGLITEVGINRMIYSDILGLYHKLLSYVTKVGYRNEHIMAKGLKSPKTHDKLDKEWYKSTVLTGYRNLLKSTSVATSSFGSKISLPDSIIIRESKIEDEQGLFQLVARIHPSEMLLNNHEWASVIWKDDEIRVWGVEDFCKHISSTYSDWKDIPNLSEKELIDWYDNFLSLVREYKESLLLEYALLPDMYGKLHKKDGSLKQNVNVSLQALDILNKLGKDKKGELLHQGITAFKLEGEYNSTSLAADINKCVEEICKSNGWLDKLMPLMVALPSDDSRYPNHPGFCIKRRDFYQIAKDLYGYNHETIEENSLIADAWREIDKRFVNASLRKISGVGKISALPQGLDVKWMNHTLIVLNPSLEQWKELLLLPNQYGEVKKKEDVYIDKDVEDILKADILKNIGINPKSYLLDLEINAQTLGIEKSQNTSGVVSSIRNRFESNSASGGLFVHNCFGRYYKYPQQVLLSVSRYLVAILPANKESEHFELQENFRGIVNILSGQEIPYVGEISYSNGDFWSVPNMLVAKNIFEKLEADKSIDTTSQRLGNIGTKRVLGLLNDFYGILGKLNINYASNAIVPNQHGVYCKLTELFDESSERDEELKDIANEIPEGHDYRVELIHPYILIRRGIVKSNEDIAKFVDGVIAKLYRDPANWQNEQFRNAVTKFIEIWAEKNKILFEKCTGTKDQKDTITVNVIYTPELRSRVQAIARTGTSIEVIEKASENAHRVVELEAEVAALKRQLESRAVASAGGCKNDISDDQKRAYLEEARKLILEDLSKDGFDISQVIYDGYTCLKGIKDKEGNDRSVVFRSNLSHRSTVISPEDWTVLSQPGAMFGVVSEHGKVGKYNLVELLKNQEAMNIRFSSSNLDWPYHLDELTKVFRYFKGIQFDFERFVPPTLERWQSFMAPELETGEQAIANSSISLPE